MHAVALAVTLNLWTALCPVALLPQNQYSGGDCPSKCNCGNSCETQKIFYCDPTCNGNESCLNQCAVTFNNCYTWCANNCPGDFGTC